MSNHKIPDHPPLPIEKDHWRSRWLVLPSWNRLHRISEIKWEDADEMIAGDGVAVCGAKGWFCMPGIFSRMGRQRCKRCCRILGIPDGDGAPFNKNIDV